MTRSFDRPSHRTANRIRKTDNNERVVRPGSALRQTSDFPGAPTATKCACGGGCPACRHSPTRQRHFTVSDPRDRREQQARQIADRATQNAELESPSVPATAARPAATGRSLGERTSSIVQKVVEAPGNRLDSATREFFEPRLGFNLASVRVHHDSQAAQSAQTAAARAYTVGNHIVFSQGTYKPESGEGRRLLAHELAHVAQHRAARGSAESNLLAREPSTSNASEADEDQSLEQRVSQQEERIRTLEEEQQRHKASDEKRRQAAQIVSDKEVEFSNLILDWQNALYRIDLGLKTGKEGIETTWLGQEKADELATQVILAAATIGVAFAFEPLFAAAMADFNPKIRKALNDWAESLGSDPVEILENPVIETVGSLSNLQGARSDLPKTQPSIGRQSSGNPLAAASQTLPANVPLEGYLNINMQTLNTRLMEVNTTFNDVRAQLNAKSDEEIAALSFEELTGRGVLDEAISSLRRICATASDMKSDTEVMRIMERHMWAEWMRRSQMRTVFRQSRTNLRPVVSHSEPSVGIYIADRLNEIMPEELSRIGVTLSASLIVPHSPLTWADLLRGWARTYRENLKK